MVRFIFEKNINYTNIFHINQVISILCIYVPIVCYFRNYYKPTQPHGTHMQLNIIIYYIITDLYA